MIGNYCHEYENYTNILIHYENIIFGNSSKESGGPAQVMKNLHNI